MTALAIAAHDTAGQFQWLWRIYVGLTIAVAVLVVGAIGFAVLRFRRRSDAWPVQRHSATRLEAVYVGAVALIVIGLLAATFRTENNEDALAGPVALRIHVTAYQWQWRFGYPGGVSVSGQSVGSAHPTYATLVVPAGRPVEFDLRSADVLHNFFIPAMRFKRYAFPNVTTRFVLQFARPGRMTGACAQFCGWDLAEIAFAVVILPDARFRSWLAGRQGAVG